MIRKSNYRLNRPDSAARTHIDGLLTDVRLAGASIAEFRFGENGALSMHSDPFLFIVAEGRCSYAIGANERGTLTTGDAILSLQGARVELSTTGEESVFRDINDVWTESAALPVSFEGYGIPIDITCGSGPTRCRLLGSAMALSRPMALSSIVRGARSPICLPAEETGLGPWVEMLATLLRHERERPRLGFAATGTAAIQFALVQILRAYLNRNEGEHASSAREQDRGHRITLLLSLLQRDPGYRWTLQEMAKRAGMSRTSFVQHLGEVTGTTPTRYLASCRMEYAAHLLRGGNLGVAQIAELCGYRSERGFRETFVRHFGCAPHAFRNGLPG